LEGLAKEDVGIFLDMRSILLPFDIVYGRLVCFVVVWYNFPVLVYCVKKNLATLEVSYPKLPSENTWVSTFGKTFDSK
jgi:hypothetical protein